MAEENDSGFRITDRRKFNPDGSPRDNADEAEPPAAPPAPPLSAEPPPPAPQADNVVSFPGDAARQREPQAPPAEPQAAEAPAAAATDDARAAQAKATATAAEQAYYQTRGPQSPDVPEASFLGLVDMFAGEAAMNLGLAQTPDGGRTPVDLDTARHWIDMLGMLEQKTQGHLNDDEAAVLQNVLAYLRMQFVGASRKR